MSRRDASGYGSVTDELDSIVRYPTRGDWVRRTAVGGLLLLVPFVAVLSGSVVGSAVGLPETLPLIGAVLSLGAMLAVTGYGVRVVRSTVRGDHDPPGFGDAVGLLVDGLAAFVLSLVYGVVGLVVLAVPWVLFAVVLAGGSAGSTANLLGASFVAVLGTVGLSLVYSLVASYLLPASICLYAAEGRLLAGLSPRRLRSVVVDSEYLLAWTLGAGGAVVLNNVASLLSVVLVGFAVQFYVVVAVARAFGIGYVRSVDPDPGPGTTGHRDGPGGRDEREDREPIRRR